MKEHNFYNYYSKKAKSQQQMAAVVKQLSQLFDSKVWNGQAHDGLLKAKVANKIHQIRRKVNRDHLTDYREALSKLKPTQHLSALQIVVDKFGVD